MARVRNRDIDARGMGVQLFDSPSKIGHANTFGPLARTLHAAGHDFPRDEAPYDNRGAHDGDCRRRVQSGHHRERQVSLILTRFGGQADYAAIAARCDFNSNSIGLT
jgi:hypothetical protein